MLLQTSLELRLIQLLASDPIRLRALAAVRRLNLPDGWIAAGFVRNLVWDELHQINTPLTDVDVIFYCPLDLSKQRERAIEKQLSQIEPSIPWSVKNQARMHLKNEVAPYQNSLDAMSFWPEKQTAVAVKMDNRGQLKVVSCFDISVLFAKKIIHNPSAPKQLFEQRIQSKGWLTRWPRLTV